MKDVDSGSRGVDVLERSIARIPFYQSVGSVKVQTDSKTVYEIAKEIVGERQSQFANFNLQKENKVL